MRVVHVALVSGVLAGCALAFPFSEVAPDDELGVMPADAGAEDAPRGADDVVVPANDADIDADAGAKKSGKVRWVATIDQGIGDSSAAAWGDARATSFGAPGFFGLTSIASGDGGGATDIVLVRFDESGVVLWTKTFGGAGDEEAHTIAVEPGGSVWITGASSSDPSLFSTAANPNARKRPFAAKLDPNGNLVFGAAIDPSAVSDGSCHGMAFGESGGAYLGCRYDGTIALTTTSDAGAQRTSNNASSDVLIARVDENSGKIVWHESYGGDAAEVLWDLVPVGNANVLAAGWFLSSNLSPTGRTRVGTNENAFAMELDGTAGLRSWVRTWGQSGSGNFVRGLAAAVGSDSSMVVGGDCRGAFDYGAAGKAILGTRSAWWSFVDRTKQGLETAFVAITNADSSTRGLGIDREGDAIAVGELSTNAPPSPSIVQAGQPHFLGYASDGRPTGFVAKTSPAGKVVWARSWISGAGYVLPRRVAIGRDGGALVYGTFTGQVDFGDGIVRTAGAKGSAFFASLAP